MSKEQYVSYEVARLLKEKGFYWDCDHYYKPNGEIVRTSHTEGSRHINSSVLYEHQCLAPTQAMAMRWLREEKGIHIYPIPVTGFHYVVSVYAEDGNKVHNRILSRSGRHAYEDATEAALEYCLTNLI